MIKIGDFAKICNVSTQTLRYYDSEGILKADVTDRSTGYRFYSVDAVDRYKQILFYKSLGFSLDDIKKIQSSTSEQLRVILQRKKEELSESIDRCRKQIKTIDDICHNNTNGSVLSDVLLLPFSNDPEVIGKWELRGALLDEHDFSSLEEATATEADKEIIFMPGGAPAWKYFWTKGTLYRISSKYKFAIPNLYRTVEINGSKYMIVRFMTNECIDSGKDAINLLYHQIDNNVYTEHQIRPHIDSTDLPFIDDEEVRGVWTVFDYVPKVEDFDPHSRFSCNDDMYTLAVQFFPRGICYRTIRTASGNVTYMLRYTKGFVLNDKEMTAEEYRIITADERDFLFVQHKSGDYFYGGFTPHWYVFERKDD